MPLATAIYRIRIIHRIHIVHQFSYTPAPKIDGALPNHLPPLLRTRTHLAIRVGSGHCLASFD